MGKVMELMEKNQLLIFHKQIKCSLKNTQAFTRLSDFKCVQNLVEKATKGRVGGKGRGCKMRT